MNKKISVIIVCHNAEDTIYRCVDGVVNADYPKTDYEILIINNGSTDRTFRIATSYDIRLIGVRKELKYSEAMALGAKNAKYEDLLFLDQRTVVKKDILNKLVELNYSPLISGELNIDKYRSDHDTFTYLINSRLYNPHFPQKKFSKELWITKKNFKKVNRNRALLYIEKEIFSKLISGGTDLDSSYDEILKRIVYDLDYRILSHTDIDVEFIGDLKVKTNREIVENGYRWAKRYLKRFNVFSFLYYSLHLALVVMVISCLNYALITLAILFVLFLIYLSDSKKDFWIMLRSAPGEIIRFYIGTVKFLADKK